MGHIGILLYAAGALGSLICWIIVLVKMFKTESSPVPGILGIICSLWAFIWGWLNSTKADLKKIMLLWTVAIIVCVLGAMMKAGSMAGQLPGPNPPIQSR